MALFEIVSGDATVIKVKQKILINLIDNYEQSIFKQFSLRHDDPPFRPVADHWLVPYDHVPFCQHHLMEPYPCIGDVPAPQQADENDGRKT
jgi:hypothetical protein